MTDLPGWFDATLFPFEQHFTDVGGARIHYVDEGEGPVMLMLHGNPTWSFLHRRMIALLRDRFRCISLDYPGFGLSKAPAEYGYGPAEHAEVLEGFIDQLGLSGVTLVLQDWGGPIGMAVAARRPHLFRAFVVGNTWAWPKREASTRLFSIILGGDHTGRLLAERLNVFINLFIRVGMRRRRPTPEEMAMWRGPFPTVESRHPVRVFPREIIGSASFLAEVESQLPQLAGRPMLILWADRDPALRTPDRRRWEALFPHHQTHTLVGAGHYWPDDAGEEAALVIARWWDQTLGSPNRH